MFSILPLSPSGACASSRTCWKYEGGVPIDPEPGEVCEPLRKKARTEWLDGSCRASSWEVGGLPLPAAADVAMVLVLGLEDVLLLGSVGDFMADDSANDGCLSMCVWCSKYAS